MAVRRSANDRRRMLTEPPNDPVKISDFNKYGQTYWDDPSYGSGYGGYIYDGRFHSSARNIAAHFSLEENATVLEIGCAKGYVLYEFWKLGYEVYGIDASAYAVSHAKQEIASRIIEGLCEKLPFDDHYFDFVYSKEVLPHVEEDKLKQSINEIIRVASDPKKIFLEIQVSESIDGQELLLKWDTTHKVARPSNWWRELLRECGYQGTVNFKQLF